MKTNLASTIKTSAWVACGSLTLAFPAFAQSNEFVNTKLQTETNLPDSSPVEITLNLLSAFLSIIGLITLILVIYSGFTILTSGGNSDKVEKGKTTLFWAIIGTIIIFSALGIILYIDSAIF